MGEGLKLGKFMDGRTSPGVVFRLTGGCQARSDME